MQGTTVTADYGASAEKLSGTVSWMLQDGHGSTRQLLNSSQTVVASYISDAFGNSVGGSGSSTNPFIWNGGSGYYSDAESGLQKVGARYYDPAVGRWISQDHKMIAGRAGDSQALNRFNYCEGNSIGRWDPSGDMPEGGFWTKLAMIVWSIGCRYQPYFYTPPPRVAQTEDYQKEVENNKELEPGEEAEVEAEVPEATEAVAEGAEGGETVEIIWTVIIVLSPVGL